MSTYEIVFIVVMGLACAAAAIWGLTREVGSDPTPVKAYWAISFSLGILCVVGFFRLAGSWDALGEGWRLLGAIGLGLFSTSAATLLALGRRLRRHRRSLQTG